MAHRCNQSFKIETSDKVTTLASGFHLAVNRTPDKTAIVCGATSLSFVQLEARVEQFRSVLQQQRPIDKFPALRIAICLENCVDVAVWYLLCVSDGHTLILMDPLWPSPLRDTVSQRLHPDIVVERPCACDAVPQPGVHYHCLFSPLQQTPDINIGKRDFLIGFTSGSSGEPKAFIRDQQSWLQSFKFSNREFLLTAEVCTLAPGPLSHGLSFYAMAESLSLGSTMVCMPNFDEVVCADLIQSAGVTHLVLVPAMLDKIVKRKQLVVGAIRSSKLVAIVTAGAKLSPELCDKALHMFPGIQLYEYYGASELSFVSISNRAESAPPESVGRAFAGVEIAIVDNKGHHLEPAASGEIQVRSSMLARGYLNDQGKLVPLRGSGDWAGVGDRGYLDASGILTIKGRVDRMMISGGYNVHPGVVEDALSACELISQVAVVPIADSTMGQLICAVLELDAQSRISFDDLVEYCKARLALYEIPKRFFVVDKMPMTASGKIAYARVNTRLQQFLAGTQDDGLAELSVTQGVNIATLANLVVEKAKPGDEGQLEALFRSAFAPYVRKLGRELGESAYDWLPDSIVSGNVWVAFRDNELAGAIVVVREETGWSIDQIAVSPAQQGMGTGSGLLREVEVIARQHGVRQLTLDTAKMMTDLVRLYQRLGFRVYREGGPDHGKDAHIRVFMEKSL